MRIPANQLIINLRGNKPLLLEKVIYTEHTLSKELKDNQISDYNPKWIKNNVNKKVTIEQENPKEQSPKEITEITWENF